MSRIFLSHSSRDNASAVALRDWLAAQGWDDVFLDLDAQRGIAAGERWERALNQAALRCEAVLFLVSRSWLASDWCLKEFNLAHRLNKRLFGLLIEDIPIGDLPVTLTGTWQLVPLASGRDHVMLAAVLPGSQDEVHVTFSQEGLTRLRIGLERAGLDARFFSWPPEADPNRPPYRGLLPLEAADAGIFFGREAPTIEAMDRLRGIKDGGAPRLLVLLGASGAGKSSFLRAGLLPRLARDDLNYLTLPVMRPERAAINGEAGLIRSLEGALAAHGLPTARAAIREAIQGGPATLRPLLRSLIERTRAALVSDGATATPPMLVLAIDQGEELFLTEGASESVALLNLLRELLSDDAPALLVVITIRSDAYEQLQTAKTLEGLTQQPLSLIPMPRGAYQSVIEGPAARLQETDRRIVVEPALTQALLSDIEDGGGRDALPLLAFTLERLYLEYGASGRLLLKDYDALGRIKGSIEAAIERAFSAADSDARIPRDREARLVLIRRGLIPWLAGIDPDTGSPRRLKARASEIPEEARPLIDLLVEQRLLSTDVSGDTGERTIEPAHESLLRQWGSLQGWLQEDFAALTNLETVKRAARDWAANAKSEDWLSHRTGRLEDAEQLLQRPDLAGKLDKADRAYLAACQERENAERQEKEAALAREAGRLAEIAEGQKQIQVGQERTARLQRRGQAMLAALAVLIMVGFGLGVIQYRSNLQRQAELDRGQVNATAERGTRARLLGDIDGALRLSVRAVRRGIALNDRKTESFPAAALAASLWQTLWQRLNIGHEDYVRSAAFSPDGTRIVTASGDKTARIWDVATAKEIAVLRGHEDVVTSAAFSPDGTRILTASRDKTARIWDVATVREIAVLRGHSSVLSAAFGPDGTRIITGSLDRTARIWDVATAKEIAVLRGHEDVVTSAAFGPDGTRIVTASYDKTARIWDVATAKEIAVLRGHVDGVWSAAFSPEGTRIVTSSSDKTARIWDVATANEIAALRGHEDAVLSAAFSPDGTRIVTASSDKTARIWDVATGKEIAVLRGHEWSVSSATFGPDGTRIVTASADKTARIWDVATDRAIAVLRGHEWSVSSATFSPDGTRIVTASDDKTARIWDVATAKEIAALRGHEWSVSSATFSPDGTRIVTASDDKTARIWDVATAKEIAVLRGHEYAVRSATFSPDGTRIVTASDDKTARIWDVATAKEIAVLRGHEHGVWSAAYSPEGTRIVTSSSDKTARIWDVATAKEIAVLRGHEDAVRSATFNPDGTRIVTASDDKTARIWDVATAKEIAVLRGHVDGVWSAAFSPEGTRIVTSSSDKTARIWDVATANEIAALRGHEDAVLSAAFSPDGTRIVAGSKDHTARIWDVHFATMPTNDMINEVCLRRLRGFTKLTHEEMRLIGSPDSSELIDVCAGITDGN